MTAKDKEIRDIVRDYASELLRISQESDGLLQAMKDAGFKQTASFVGYQLSGVALNISFALDIFDSELQYLETMREN